MPAPPLALGRRHLDDAGPGGCRCSLIDLAIGPRRPARAGPGRSQPPALLLLGNTRLRFRDGRVLTTATATYAPITRLPPSLRLMAYPIPICRMLTGGFQSIETASSSFRRPAVSVSALHARMHALSSTEMMNWSYRLSSGFLISPATNC